MSLESIEDRIDFPEDKCSYCGKQHIFFLIPVYLKTKDVTNWYCTECFKRFVLQIKL